MTEWFSAVGRHRRPGRHGAPGEVGVVLGEIQPIVLIQFAAWPETLVRMGRVASKAAGVSEAPGPGRVRHAGASSLLRVEPLKWWLVSRGSDMRLPQVASDVGAVLDLSHARTLITVKGPRAEALLAHVMPIDFRLKAFDGAAVVSSAIHHVGVTVWRTDDRFDLLVPRSFAAAIWQLLDSVAQQYGLEIH
jgi:heterotetrameric sarcosine oxidase gamma subunit